MLYTTKIQICLLAGLFLSLASRGQATDTSKTGVVIHRDYRMAQIKEKEAEINTAILKIKARSVQGYRLMILNTRDKDYAFKVRTELLQKFPEQKPYMWFANPYIRLKFGNFRTKQEAEDYEQRISKMLGGIKLYLIDEIIEVNPGNDFDPESMRDQTLQ